MCADLCLCGFEMATSAHHFLLWSPSAACDTRQAPVTISVCYMAPCLRQLSVLQLMKHMQIINMCAANITQTDTLQVAQSIIYITASTASLLLKLKFISLYLFYRCQVWSGGICLLLAQPWHFAYELINLNNTMKKNTSLQYLNVENYSHFSYFSNTDKQPTSVTVKVPNDCKTSISGVSITF